MATNLNRTSVQKDLDEQKLAMLLLDLKQAEERAEKERWIEADELEMELGVI